MQGYIPLLSHLYPHTCISMQGCDIVFKILLLERIYNHTPHSVHVNGTGSTGINAADKTVESMKENNELSNALCYISIYTDHMSYYDGFLYAFQI